METQTLRQHEGAQIILPETLPASQLPDTATLVITLEEVMLTHHRDTATTASREIRAPTDSSDRLPDRWQLMIRMFILGVLVTLLARRREGR